MLKEIFRYSLKISKFTRICIENHSSVTGWQKLILLIQILLVFGGRCNRCGLFPFALFSLSPPPNRFAPATQAVQNWTQEGGGGASSLLTSLSTPGENSSAPYLLTISKHIPYVLISSESVTNETGRYDQSNSPQRSDSTLFVTLVYRPFQILLGNLLATFRILSNFFVREQLLATFRKTSPFLVTFGLF